MHNRLSIGDVDSLTPITNLVSEDRTIKRSAILSISRLDPNSPSIITWVREVATSSNIDDVSDILYFISGGCDDEAYVRYRYAFETDEISRFRGIESFSRSRATTSPLASAKHTIVIQAIRSLIDRGVNFSIGSLTLFSTSSTIDFSDGKRSDQIVASLGLCLYLRRVLMSLVKYLETLCFLLTFPIKRKP